MASLQSMSILIVSALGPVGSLSFDFFLPLFLPIKPLSRLPELPFGTAIHRAFPFARFHGDRDPLSVITLAVVPA